MTPQTPWYRTLPVWTLALPMVLFLLILYAWPVGSVLTSSVTQPHLGLEHYRELDGNSVYAPVFTSTFWLALTVSGLTLAVGYPIAFFLTVASPRQRRITVFFLLMSSWTSVLVRTYGWVVLLGRQGIINGLLLWLGAIQRPLTLLYNGVVVRLAMVEILLPFLVLPIYHSMRSIDLKLMDAASGLGAGRFDRFRRIYLPLTLPGVLSGLSIVLMLSLGFFITPMLLGGRRELTVSMLIMQQFTSVLNWGLGAALATALLSIGLLALSIVGLAQRRRSSI